MNILVTGAAGFIGFHLCKRLLADGHTVVGVDNLQAYNAKDNMASLSKHNNFFGHELDVTELGNHSTNDTVDVVIHLAAAPRVQYSFDSLVNSSYSNIVPLAGVLQFMLNSNIKSIVFASSSTAKTGMSPYGLQKKYCEDLLLLYQDVYGIEPVILRYHSVYGPGMDADSPYALLIPRAIKAAETGEEFPLYGDGTVERDFTYIDDIVETTIRSFTVFKGGSDTRFDVGAATPVTVAEILEIIEEQTGKPILRKFYPARVEPQQTKADTEPMEKFFSFKPSITIREGITKLIETKQ